MTAPRVALRHSLHRVDVCVVGGGMAGICAALAAARHGARVALLHDRPVLGGNASSECRVHICGADRHGGIPNLRETGILEELRLENLARNPQRSFSVWDTVLYEAVRLQPNLDLLLNCSVLDARMRHGAIGSVTGWQLTTETHHTVQADVFIDCSGDAILAPLTGAAFRVGRESRHEFGESIAPEEADAKTMGMTCLFQARRHESPQPFEPPPWAYRFETDSELPYGTGGHRWWEMGYWWVELGGEHDSIHDTEALRDELLRILYGVWDHIKNRGDHGADCWALEWVQFLPAKRESRRYEGELMVTQGDLESGGRFIDTVAYGGWAMDDHHPAGFWSVRIGEPSTQFHPTPSPYGIPLRALISRDVANLMFAGRCASFTHAAMSSARVMGTGAVMGQAAGTCAAMAAASGVRPSRMVGRAPDLQQALLRDDCYLPGVPEHLPELTRAARLEASTGDPSPLLTGINRPVGDDRNSWPCAIGDHVSLCFVEPRHVGQVGLVLDSGLDLIIAMSYHQADAQLTAPPPVLPRCFRIDVLRRGLWETHARITRNHQRLVRVPVGVNVEGVRFTLEETWGSRTSQVFRFAAEPSHGNR